MWRVVRTQLRFWRAGLEVPRGPRVGRTARPRGLRNMRCFCIKFDTCLILWHLGGDIFKIWGTISWEGEVELFEHLHLRDFPCQFGHWECQREPCFGGLKIEAPGYPWLHSCRPSTTQMTCVPLKIYCWRATFAWQGFLVGSIPALSSSAKAHLL